MKAYFVRHGESEQNAVEAFQHDANQLSARGKEQAGFLAERFKKISVSVIIASPLERAKQTAEVISHAIDIPIQYSPIFRERKRPSEIHGKSLQDPEALRIHRLLLENFTKGGWKYSDEEMFSELKERAEEVIQFIEGFEGKDVLVVTHGVITLMILARMMFGNTLTAEESEKLRKFCVVENTGITLCERKVWWGDNDPWWRLVTWNDHAHLG